MSIRSSAYVFTSDEFKSLERHFRSDGWLPSQRRSDARELTPGAKCSEVTPSSGGATREGASTTSHTAICRLRRRRRSRPTGSEPVASTRGWASSIQP